MAASDAFRAPAPASASSAARSMAGRPPAPPLRPLSPYPRKISARVPASVAPHADASLLARRASCAPSPKRPVITAIPAAWANASARLGGRLRTVVPELVGEHPQGVGSLTRAPVGAGGGGGRRERGG